MKEPNQAFEIWLENRGGCTADIYDDFRNAFEAGAKWQADQDKKELDEIQKICRSVVRGQTPI